MIDGFVLLAPLLLLPLVLLLIFVGCTVDRSGSLVGRSVTFVAEFDASLAPAPDFIVFIDVYNDGTGNLMQTLEASEPEERVDPMVRYRLPAALTPSITRYRFKYQVWPDGPGGSTRLIGPECCTLRAVDITTSPHEVRFASPPGGTSVTMSGCTPSACS